MSITLQTFLALMPINLGTNFQVYKSSSKRKSHILKNHPGASLPHSGNMMRKNDYVEVRYSKIVM